MRTKRWGRQRVELVEAGDQPVLGHLVQSVEDGHHQAGLDEVAQHGVPARVTGRELRVAPGEPIDQPVVEALPIGIPGVGGDQRRYGRVRLAVHGQLSRHPQREDRLTRAGRSQQQQPTRGYAPVAAPQCPVAPGEVHRDGCAGSANGPPGGEEPVGSGAPPDRQRVRLVDGTQQRLVGRVASDQLHEFVGGGAPVGGGLGETRRSGAEELIQQDVDGDDPGDDAPGPVDLLEVVP